MLNFNRMQPYAVIFPGQGSQSVGMLSNLAPYYPEIEATFAIASRVLGFDTWALAQEGPVDLLNQTENTQPLLLAADIALWRALVYQYTFPPRYLAGHSLGEYAALVAAQALGFEDALRLVQRRGRLMQAAVPENTGAMAAVLGASDRDIQAACDAVNQLTESQYSVDIANYNAIGQTVIAGHTQAVHAVIARLKTQGCKSIILPVSVPSHCRLMQGASEQLAAYLARVQICSPIIPIIHNKDLQSYAKPAAIRQIIVEQLVHPVCWLQTIQHLFQQGIVQMVECGPGKILAGLIKRIEPRITVHHF